MATVLLDGKSLHPALVVDIGYNPLLTVGLTDEAWTVVKRGREVVEEVIERKEVAYGLNTGFGNFANVIIAEDKLSELQENLIRSHAAGVGELLSPQRVRMLMTLRINVLAKGHSGIRSETLQQCIDALNKCCLPAVPSQGTVGASGDLAPLAHLALGLMGEGAMFDPADKTYKPAAEVLKKHDLTPIKLQAKEGLALINGTQFIVSLGSEAVVRAARIARQADIVSALTLEALKGSVKAFNPKIHEVRPHNGQINVAGRIRSVLHSEKYPSEISQSHKFCGRVQDSYTLRCIPQIHGIVHDTVKFVHEILVTECNSATDNPMIFVYDESEPESDDIADESTITLPKSTPSTPTSAKPVPTKSAQIESKINQNKPKTSGDHAHESKKPNSRKGFTISGGNFHGEYPAKALDYLAIGIHEISSVSERRIERLVNPTLSELPAFLTRSGGLNSGFMIAHCTAAALVSENKVLCHPSSVDSLSTSAAKEDHVSMGGFAARKALSIVENVETVIAIELLAACQALEFLRPLTTTRPLELVYKLVREQVKPWDRDRYMSPDIEACKKLLQAGKIWETVAEFIDEKYHRF